SREDGDNPRQHAMGAVTLDAGDYLVVGGVLPEFALDHVDYGYGDDLGNLGNSAGRLAIRCDVIEIDAAIYADMADGQAQALSAGGSPDYLINDDLANWCASSNEFLTGSFGTPGQANDCFGSGSGDGMCADGDARRPVVTAAAGDLIITELMPNPSVVSDANGEWFEVYVTRDIDLNGVTIGREPVEGADLVINAAECLAATAGTYLVFAKNSNMAENGGLPRVDYEFGFSLTNSAGTLFVGVGSEVLDQISWDGSSDGASTNLDAAQLDPAANDDLELWCPTSDGATYGAGDSGTPGAANEGCGPVVSDGLCDEDGTPRAIVSPTAEQVTITEYMPDPNVVSDSNGEWFEVRFDAAVDLNGLQLGREPGSVSETIDSAECLRVAA
ncbi:MAG: hypothetical protein AAGC55_32310, partial [Myxococcota bacterium]